MELGRGERGGAAVEAGEVADGLAAGGRSRRGLELPNDEHHQDEPALAEAHRRREYWEWLVLML